MRVNIVDGSATVPTKTKVVVLVTYFFSNLVLTLSNKEILNFVSLEALAGCNVESYSSGYVRCPARSSLPPPTPSSRVSAHKLD